MADNDGDSLKPAASAAKGTSQNSTSQDSSGQNSANQTDEDYDPTDQITPLRRVEVVGSSIVAMHREFPEPKHETRGKREGVALVLKPWSPAGRQRQMHTMSDLNDMARTPLASEVAKVRNRHLSTLQAEAARAGADKPKDS